MCQPIDIIRLHLHDFGTACRLSAYMVLRHVGKDHVLVETNRYSRRELTRFGIPFCYPSDNCSCGEVS